MKIYKYPAHYDVEMPKGAVVLDVQMQGRHVVLWALVDTDQPKETRHFRIVGTGGDIVPNDQQWTYLKTIQDNEFVWHVFEVRQ